MPLIDLAGLGHFKDKENEMIAADYSATKTYAVGDYVYYNGVLKRCTTAITTAEAYTAAHWTNAVLAGDVTELKTAFTQQVTLQSLPLVFGSGGLNGTTGGTSSTNTRIRISGSYVPRIEPDDFLTVDPQYKVKLFIYRRSLSTANFIESYPADFINGTIKIPSEYYGYNLSLLIQKVGYESADISGDVATIGNYIKLWRTTDTLYDVEKLDESIFKYNAPVDSSHFIDNGNYLQLAINTGGYNTVANPSTVSYIGSRVYYEATAENPLMVSMPDNYCFDIFFYTTPEQANYINHTGYITGKVILNGNYYGTSYSVVRFNIKPNPSAVGQYENLIANFKLYRTSKYLQGSAGGTVVSTKYFNVYTNLNWPNTISTAKDTEETDTNTETLCILKLPANYTITGKPVPLIMFGHGASCQITNDLWYSTSSWFELMINAFLDAGYAIFDVNNTRNQEGGFPDWGALPLMTSYIKAWQYIKTHYNVEQKLYILSDSMGTAANLNMLKWYSGDIITSLITAPRVCIKKRYEDYTGTLKTQMAEAFGLTNGVWDEDRLKGFENYENIITLNDVGYVFENFPPVKVMVGQADTSYLSEVREYFTALSNTGNFVNYREVADADHAVMSFLENTALRAEAVAWFDRFRYQENN